MFATLEDLRDKEKPMDIDRALAVAEVAGKIIESAKVEAKFIEIAGGGGTGFIPRDEVQAAKLTPKLVGNSK